MLSRRAGTLFAVVLLTGPGLVACGGGSDESARDLLTRAKGVLDDASSVHFALDSADVPEGGTGLLGGEGDLARPESFAGGLRVAAGGASVEVEVVSVEGTVYAQLPFTTGFSTIDPAEFGLGDPADLLDPEDGISQFLAAAESPELGEERRVGGQVVREVTAEIPGDLVEDVLTSEDPSRPVQARFSIAAESGELRRAELTGPFFAGGEDSTYTIELSDFGDDVEITAPPTG